MAVLHVLAQYIVHAQAITGVPLADAAIAFVLAYGATWALSTLSYWTIEEPFLRMRRGYGSTRNAPLVNAA
jgi:peptidoglycan/LPS O-acetylase OafA/YrhL